MSLVAKEEIYETEDVPVVPDEEEFSNRDDKNPDIEKIGIDIDAVLKKFGDRVLNLKSVDFSDSIAKKRRNNYGGGNYVLEVVGSAYGDKETLEQKLNRIVYEISELNESISNNSADKTDLLNEETIKALTSEVNNLKVRKEISENVFQDTTPQQLPDVKTSPQLKELEGRLRRLEGLLLGSTQPSAPILDTIENLKLRCEALNAKYVEGVEERLFKMVDKLKETNDSSQLNPELTKKVDEIHDMMAKWDVECSSLASSTKKVNSLSELHEQAKSFAENLAHLKAVKDKLEAEVVEGKTVINDILHSDQQVLKTLTESMAKVEKMVNELK